MKKVLLLFLATILTLVTLYGCAKKNQINLGVYTTEDEIIEESSINLMEDDKFTFKINPISSYLPTGTFNIKGDKLILKVTEDEEYIFKIEEDKLIFQSGKLAEKYIEKEKEYIYSKGQ